MNGINGQGTTLSMTALIQWQSHRACVCMNASGGSWRKVSLLLTQSPQVPEAFAPSCTATPRTSSKLFSEAVDLHRGAKDPGSLEHVSPGLQPRALQQLLFAGRRRAEQMDGLLTGSEYLLGTGSGVIAAQAAAVRRQLPRRTVLN